MKWNIFANVFCLACIAGTGFAAESDVAALLGKTFPGKTLSNLTFHDFKKLDPAQRDKVVAAITKSGPLDNAELDLFQALANVKLLTEPSVIESLVDALNRAAPMLPASSDKAWDVVSTQNANAISTALDVLWRVTRRTCGEAVRDQREKRPEKIREVADWWMQWWTTNRNKQLLIDPQLETSLTERLAAIEARLVKDLAGDYPELKHLHPKDVSLRGMEPLFDEGVDSPIAAEGITRRTADGKPRDVTDDDHIFLRITLTFKTPLPPDEAHGALSAIPARWNGSVEKIFTEEVPGTEIVISVEAAQKGGVFPHRARESLAKLPPVSK